ncbi:MAG TPA: ATP-binding protein [Spirochaetota bacterium]|jgi:PAS domain S-box-containing protein|nr:ATP-binding protein [Spirochaetota bacterium]HOH36617.1 ATP-binding protein [Spirochaetota bacterium]HPJ14903.1 ATP-binding protein [Spirochaetota bacterium]HPM33831.1 ATP-binding protein [Spirochaetota bacterium]HPY02279.1 ATP-binding protein [Spirochaetota bacterium]
MIKSSEENTYKEKIRELEETIIQLEKQIEELRRSRDEYREVFLLSPNLLCTADLNNACFTKINPAFVEKLGYSEKELLSRPFLDFVHPDDIEATLKILEKELKEGKRIINFSNRYKCADGTDLWLDWVSHPFPERGVTFAAAHDITNQKLLEQELRDNQNFIRSVMDNLPIGIAVNLVEPAVEFYYMNDNFPKLYRTTREALKDSNTFWEAVYEDPDFREKMKKRVLDDCATGNPDQMIWDGIPITRKGEETRYISARNTPVPERGIMISSVWDVTDIKRSEIDRQKLQEQLALSQRMESIGLLAGGVAHDFNNMLGVIMGHTDLILDIIAPDDRISKSILEIQDAARRSANLTQQLLTFARKQTVSPRVLDINQVISGMLDMMRRLIGENIKLNFKPSEDSWKIKMDPGQIDQVLANLCVNARDAIKEVGLVSIETNNVSFRIDDPFLENQLDSGDYVLITVTDSGSGMNKEVMEHLFDPFYTTKVPGKGTGLGLSTVYGIIKQNNGNINVESEPGRGSIFRIYLPRYQGEDYIRESAVEKPRKNKKNNINTTILLVEDEIPILNACTEMLQRLNYHVLYTSSPLKAISIAKEYQGSIDLLITDVIMPEMNGKDLSGKIAELHPGIKHLFMSGYTADIIAHHGVLEDGVNFLQKPFSLSRFSLKLEEIMGQETKQDK